MKSRGLIIVLIALAIVSLLFGALQWREAQALRKELANVDASGSSLSRRGRQVAGPVSTPGGAGVTSGSGDGSLQERASDELPTVEVKKADLADLSRTVTYNGIIEPRRSVVVTPKSQGRVGEVRFEVGDRVRKGDLLVRIEAEEIRLQVRQAAAALELAEANLARVRAGARPEERSQAQAVVDQARASFEAAKEAYERTKILFEENVISQQEMDKAETQYQVAKSQLASAEQQLNMVLKGAKPEEIRAAEAQVAQAKAAYDLASLQLSNAEVRTPINGVVAQRMVDEGAMIGVTSPVCAIVDTDTVRITLGVSEEDVVDLAAGREAEITVDSIPGRSFAGKIVSISPAADKQTRLFSVVVEAANPDGSLRPGMYATVRIVAEKASGVVAVPAQALVTDSGYQDGSAVSGTAGGADGDADASSEGTGRPEKGQYVLVVAGGVCERRAVETGLRAGELVEIKSGVTPGELVVVSGQDRLSPGQAVQVIDL